MLVNCNEQDDEGILSVIANNKASTQLREGVLQIHHFGSSHWPDPEKFNHYTVDLSVGPYGVCDSVEQLLEKCPELEASDRQFFVTVTPILKNEQSPLGGWRWHKWGTYIGNQTPTTEYLFDEPLIEKVYVYHIHEKL